MASCIFFLDLGLLGNEFFEDQAISHAHVLKGKAGPILSFPHDNPMCLNRLTKPGQFERELGTLPDIDRVRKFRQGEASDTQVPHEGIRMKAIGNRCSAEYLDTESLARIVAFPHVLAAVSTLPDHFIYSQGMRFSLEEQLAIGRREISIA